MGHYEATGNVLGTQANSASWLAMSKGNGRPLEGIQLEGDITGSVL